MDRIECSNTLWFSYIGDFESDGDGDREDDDEDNGEDNSEVNGEDDDVKTMVKMTEWAMTARRTG